MKRQLNTLALMALITSTAFAGFNAPLPEFKTPKQLAEWRAELAAKSAATSKATTEGTAFYTGKPYVESTGSYAFKYRAYNPELARWTSEDPSGFPDGTNNQVFVPAPSFMFDANGLWWETYNQGFGRQYKTLITVIIQTSTSIQLTGVSASIGANSNGPTGGFTINYSITHPEVQLSKDQTSQLEYSHDDDLPQGENWVKSGEYLKILETTRDSRIENNTPLGNDSFRSTWASITRQVGTQVWQRWYE